MVAETSASHEQERLLDPDNKRMARVRLPSRLRLWCKPLQVSVVAVFLSLTLISLGTTYYYWQYSYAISGCANSVAALPPERIHRGNATHVWKLCVVVVIGDDGGVPSFNRLPFWKLRRIFQRVLSVAKVPGEVGLVEPDLRNVLVRTDYTSLVCKLARDALGPAVKCESFLDLPNSEQRVSLLSHLPSISLHISRIVVAIVLCIPVIPVRDRLPALPGDF